MKFNLRKPNRIATLTTGTYVVLASFVATFIVPMSALAWNLQGSCAGVPPTVNVGETVTWTATRSSTGTASDSHYEYFWSGTNSLSGTSQSVSKTYTTAGTKNATVVIKLVINAGGSESITRSCSITVTNPPPPPTLVGSCAVAPSSAAIGDNVSWSSAVSGGTGTYSYSWTGDDGLSGTSANVTKTYNTSGTKNGTVTITSGAQTVSDSCHVTIASNPPPLVTFCVASPSSVNTGVPVSWVSSVSGGTGTYTYSWTGDEGLSGTYANLSKTYSSTGTKQGNVTVTSGSQTGTASCVVTVTNPPPPTTLDGLCFATPSSVHTGDTVHWGATATGGTGSYTYSWSGDEGLSGTSNLSKTYNSTGIKNASVVITSGSNQRITRSCQVEVTATPPQPPLLTGSCLASPSSAHTSDTITWTATPSGGTGSYTYSWSGTDSLSGTSVSVNKSYNTTGTKQGTVVIASGSQTVSANCETSITSMPITSAFSAICSVSPSVIHSGESATWTATATGGTGTYTYAWTGSEGLSGNTDSVTKTYGSTGSKNASVTVMSGSDTTTASCSLNVLPPPGCTQNCGGGGGGGGGGFNPPTVVLLKKPPVGQVLSAVFLSQIPYTGFGDGYKVALFLLILGLWSVAAVYFFRAKLWRRKRDTFAFNHTQTGYGDGPRLGINEGVVEAQSEESPLIEEPSYVDINQIINSPMYTETIVPKEVHGGGQARAGIVDIIAAEAQRNHAIISEEGMKIIADKGKNDAAQALVLVSAVIKSAEERYDREDGWLLLNKEKVSASLTDKATVSDVSARSTPAPIPDVSSARVSSPSPNAFTAGGKPSVDSALFVSWLATGDKQQVARYLKTLRDQLGSAEAFLKKVVLDLDIVYRSRFDEIEETIDERLSNTVSGLSNIALEDLISVLLSTVDQSYHSSSLGIKLALMRATEVGKRR
ncbi:MAG: hypothetical protein A3C06_03280 [Candidatus Taylorbacteria bacterium RIFCSPHIGHO2_02_FULL_46_13]|uniref:PKD domain-containing protein n=1 Tax=Candidatus Taylorbacteria bacterium RIFCSPHIGHO2_02_FULL_46_13 TaxID=1802312 RepID=A0A1G2MRP4_9BACT|nr:MAG: hypothetical protein A3C06_03280 [Candidatus Taylorbacteria bacterium RIFCSPHIGHO2_02_FULL_46_13]